VLEAREPRLKLFLERESLTEAKLGVRYDEDLTYAVLAAAEEKTDESLRYLKSALNNRPYIESRTIYPLYQVVDIAQLLYRETGHDQFREFALELARRHKVVLPMYAWAYFVVATYSESIEERIEAAASGLYLDPLSSRGFKLPRSLIDAAKKRLNDNGAPNLNRIDKIELGT